MLLFFFSLTLLICLIVCFLRRSRQQTQISHALDLEETSFKQKIERKNANNDFFEHTDLEDDKNEFDASQIEQLKLLGAIGERLGDEEEYNIVEMPPQPQSAPAEQIQIRGDEEEKT